MHIVPCVKTHPRIVPVLTKRRLLSSVPLCLQEEHLARAKMAYLLAAAAAITVYDEAPQQYDGSLKLAARMIALCKSAAAALCDMQRCPRPGAAPPRGADPADVHIFLKVNAASRMSVSFDLY